MHPNSIPNPIKFLQIHLFYVHSTRHYIKKFFFTHHTNIQQPQRSSTPTHILKILPITKIATILSQITGILLKGKLQIHTKYIQHTHKYPPHPFNNTLTTFIGTSCIFHTHTLKIPNITTREIHVPSLYLLEISSQMLHTTCLEICQIYSNRNTSIKRTPKH